MKTSLPRATLLGLLSWFAPFAFSFLFVDRTGQFLIPQPLFKSVMVVAFGAIDAALLVVAFERLVPSLRCGLVIGCYWLAINLILDMVILVPIMRVSVVDYIYDIGLRYLLIPIIGGAMGLIAQRTRASAAEGA